ncbi:MAG: sulfatase-like hydrolase/transferase [Planctomycetota bacterium]
MATHRAAADVRREANEPPNIVVFLTDDQGYGDLGCYGSKSLETPHIDRVCAEGMKFTDFYVHPRCSPTRLAFMTSCYAHRAGTTKVIYHRDRMGIHADEITTPELLRDTGYATALVGKWHLGEWDVFNPVRHGFDQFYGFMVDDNTLFVFASYCGRRSNPGGKSGRAGERKAAPAGSLFDLKEDVGETNDVAAQHPDVVMELEQQMKLVLQDLERNGRPIGRHSD